MCKKIIKKIVPILILSCILMFFLSSIISRTYADEDRSDNDFADNFRTNGVGTVISLIAKGFRAAGDGIQTIINCIQNSTLHIDKDLMYTYGELRRDVTAEEFCEENGIDTSEIEYDSDGNAVVHGEAGMADVHFSQGAGNTNAYTNVGDYVSGGNSASDLKEGQIGIDVTETYYNDDTEIPVITVDYYSFAINDISFLDINYLTGDADHDDGSPWMIIRNFVSGFIRMTFYIAAVCLITMLILHGINIVKFSLLGLDNPKKQLDTKKGMNKFITAVSMLVGTVVITSLCIFGTESLCNIIAVQSINNGGDESTSEHELPIRVHVASADYSFSTNFTGYARYMSQIDNVDEYMTTVTYTLVYLIFVVMNVIGLGFMLFRLFALYMLDIYGPITVVMYMFSKDSEPGKIPRNYKNWACLYLVICLTQVIFAISYRAVISWIVD